MNITQALVSFWHLIHGDPQTVAYDKLQDAVKRRARLAAEVEYEKHMVTFYTNQSFLIEQPITTSVVAYAYARALEKKELHSADLVIEQRRYAEANARVDACEARLEKLRYPTVSRVAQR